jgi:hypothetical protein
LFTRIAHALRAPATLLYQHKDEDGPDVQVICASPPIVVFGPRLVGQTLAEPERRFLLGRAAELCQPSRIIAAGLSKGEFVELMDKVVRVFGAQKPRTTLPPEDEAFRQAFPVRVRARISELLAERPLAPLSYVKACHEAADRAGLMVAGELEMLLRHLHGYDGKTVPVHVIELVLKPAYRAIRKKLLNAPR